MNKKMLLVVIVLLVAGVPSFYRETLAPLENRLAPQTHAKLWADFILLHGNGVKDPKRIAEMVTETKAIKGYKPMPILYNEDDHLDFDQPSDNMVEAVKASASWGFFDYRKRGADYDYGFQSVPVNWRISSPRKKAFFDKLEEITGGLK